MSRHRKALSINIPNNNVNIEDYSQSRDILLFFLDNYEKFDSSVQDFIVSNINLTNFYIFICFTISNNINKEVNYLPFIQNFIFKRFSIPFSPNYTEITFEETFLDIITMNALSQSIDLGLTDIVLYLIRIRNYVYASIVCKLIYNKHFFTLKRLMEGKYRIVDFAESSLSTNFSFIPLETLNSRLAIYSKFNSIDERSLVYYLYKCRYFSDEDIKTSLRSFMQLSIFQFRESEVLPLLIKSNDQELVEDILVSERIELNDEIFINSIRTALIYRNARVAYLLYQYIKYSGGICKSEMIHNPLIKAFIHNSENIEIYLYLTKKLLNYFSQVNIRYLLSIISQLIFFDSPLDCKILKVINPLKVTVLIVELCDLVYNRSVPNRVKAKELYSEFLLLAETITEESTNNHSLERCYNDKDLENRSLLEIICQNNLLSLINNSTSKFCISKIWNGIYSDCAKVTSICTSYNVMNSNSYEDILSIISKLRSRINLQQCFSESFVVWKHSIKIKSYIRNFLFLILILCFKLYTCYVFKQFPGTIYDEEILAQSVIELEKNLEDIYKQNIPIDDFLTNTQCNQTGILSDLQYIAVLEKDIMVHISSNFNKVCSNTRQSLISSNIFSYIFLFLPIDHISSYYYRKKTRIQISYFDLQTILDLIILTSLTIRIIYIDSNIDRFFNFNSIKSFDATYINMYKFLTAIIFICLSLKTLLYLKLSLKLGPFIRILESILLKLCSFALIFIGEFTFFGLTLNILFSANNQYYDSIPSSILSMFRAIVVDFNYFSGSEKDFHLHALLLSLHLITSMVILLHFLIAILNNVFEFYRHKSSLLLPQDIINQSSKFLPDEHYGGFLLIPFPLSIINLILIPVNSLFQDRELVKSFNRCLLRVAYSPVFVLSVLGMVILEILFFLFFIPKLIAQSFFYVLSKRTSCSNMLVSVFTSVGLILFAPVLLVYWTCMDISFYMKYLLKYENLEMIYLEKHEAISPYVINMIKVILSKDYNQGQNEFMVSEMVDEFMTQIKDDNGQLEITKILIASDFQTEKITFLKEYMDFVEIMEKLQLRNEFNEAIISRKLFKSLMESNENYCKLFEYYEGNKYSFSKRVSCIKNSPIGQYTQTNIQKFQHENILNISQSYRNSSNNSLLISTPSSINLLSVQNPKNSYIKESVMLKIEKSPNKPATIKRSFTEEYLFKIINASDNNNCIAQQDISINNSKNSEIFYRRLIMINQRETYEALHSYMIKHNLDLAQSKISIEMKNIRYNLDFFLSFITLRPIRHKLFNFDLLDSGNINENLIS